MNIGIISLGCAKNQVDLEEILAYLKKNGFETVQDPDLADIILINTCGFIDAAKKESIDAILEMIEYKKPVVVTGCLATRYLEDLKKEIPEVSLWIPLEDYKNFGEKSKNGRRQYSALLDVASVTQWKCRKYLPGSEK